jgi:hypothetical protein
MSIDMNYHYRVEEDKELCGFGLQVPKIEGGRVFYLDLAEKIDEIQIFKENKWELLKEDIDYKIFGTNPIILDTKKFQEDTKIRIIYTQFHSYESILNETEKPKNIFSRVWNWIKS